VNGPLNGVTLVVTRPAAQAGAFMEQARTEGARCIAMPAIVIEPVERDVDQRRRARTDRFDWIVFTSTNAVEYGLPHLPTPLHARIVAVGPATARALEQHGATVTVRPDSANSEGILALPEFAAPQDQRILLVKGRGGRELLRDELASRGADVTELEVYERRPADLNANSLRALRRALRAGTDCVIAVTSQEVLELFLARLDAADSRCVRTAALLAPGARVVAAARRLGWDGPILEAATAEDASMLETLRAHRRGTASSAW